MYDFATEDDLLDRLTAQLDDIVFLIGSAITAPSRPGEPGVPRVNDIVAEIRRRYNRPEEIARFNQALGIEPENHYRAAFRHLQKTRGQKVANAVIRACVLQAREPSAIHMNPDTEDDNAAELCRNLESDLLGWHLPPAAEALGKIVARQKPNSRRIVLTSNFDPLAEISIRRAGDHAITTALDSDGGFSAIDGLGTLVVHFHGDWCRSDTLHSPIQLGQDRPQLAASLNQLLSTRVLVAIGYGGWDDIFTLNLIHLMKGRTSPFDILWAFHDTDSTQISEHHHRLLTSLQPGIDRARVTLYKSIDAHTFLPRLMGMLETTPPSRKAPLRHVNQTSANNIGGNNSANHGNASPPSVTAQNLFILLVVISTNEELLSTDIEVRGIFSSIQGSLLRSRIEVERLDCESLTDPSLYKTISEKKPGAVYITGPQECLPKSSQEDIAKYFSSHNSSVNCVFINVANSSNFARTLVRSVPMAIGMNGDRSVDFCTDFSSAFYEAIGFGRSVGNAFSVALASLDEKVREIPQLFPTGASDYLRVRARPLVTSSSSIDGDDRSSGTHLPELSVLMISANPEYNHRIRVDKEFRDIVRRMRKSKLRERIRFTHIPAACFEDLRTGLLEHEPHVLHISMMGEKDGSLRFESREDDGVGRLIPKRNLLALLRSAGKRLKGVLFSASHSHLIAQDMPPSVDFSIGMRTAADDEAIQFSVSFYEALGYGRSIFSAFSIAAALIDSEDDILLFPFSEDDPDGKLNQPLLLK